MRPGLWYLVVLMAITACSSINKATVNCNENEHFKTISDYHFQQLNCYYGMDCKPQKADENLTVKEKLELLETPKNNYRKALVFISDYVPVSFKDTMNYAQSYPYGRYLKLRENWDIWYEANKCDHIELKEY